MSFINERDIAVIMATGRTESEAKRHLNNGSVVFTAADLENNLEEYIQEWALEEEEADSMRRMVETGDLARDWETIEYNCEKYYIMFVL